MDINIKQVTDLPQDIHVLAESALTEGLNIVSQLITDFETKKKQFDQPGEFLLLAYEQDKLVACGGLNLQWNDYEVEHRIGRVRRFYVLPTYRKKGVGKLLLQALEQKAKQNFSALCLNTESKDAVQFYQKMNYVFVENHPNYNYFKYLI